MAKPNIELEPLLAFAEGELPDRKFSICSAYY